MKILIALILSCIFINTVFAEDPERGRLPDGRAFRTDAQGNQLVDYIAELELGIESLNRKVQGLEDENREKQAQIVRLQSGKPPSPELVERDLNSVSQKIVCPPVKPQECICPSTSNLTCPACPTLKAVDCNCPAPEPVIPSKIDCDSVKSKFERQLEDVKVDYDLSNQKLKNENSELKANIDKLTIALEASNSKQAEDNKKIVALQQELASDRSVTISSKGLKTAESEAVSERSTVISSVVNSEKRSANVEPLRTKMLKELNSVQSLVSSRDALYRQAKGSSASLPPQLSSVTETSQTIVQLRTGINEANSNQELADFRTKINELRGKLQQEIGLLRRAVRK